MVNEKVHPLNGMTVHTVKTDKFKTLTLILQMRAPLNPDTVTKRALLAYVLKSATAKSPSTQELQQRLDDLYGAVLSSQVQKRGNDHILSLIVHTANERFLTGASTLSRECIELLAETVFQPLADNGAFDEKTVNKEKRALKQRLESVFDDKMRYANERLIDEMCKDELYALHTYGYVEEIERITPKDLYEYFQKALKEDEIDLYVVGDIEHDAMAGLIERAFHFNHSNRAAQPFIFEPVKANEPRVIKENQDVEQGKLNLGYRTNIVANDPLYYAAQVFNGLFGGFPHSKLFMNVREKASLAYYAASRYDSYKGILIVMSGIEIDNYDKAVTIIDEQLKSLQNGEFNEPELEQTKALLKNAILESLDNPFSLIDQLYRKVLIKDSDDLENWFSGIDQVTPEEVRRVANAVELDTVYFLQNKA
ncbi:MAG: EF-P 5-aminopentanol modification-associated protein YfmF [Tuberibacillus sp.]